MLGMWWQSFVVNLVSRSRLTIQLVRITIGLPLKVEQAMIADPRYRRPENSDEKLVTSVVLPRQILLVIQGVVFALERMEGILG